MHNFSLHLNKGNYITLSVQEDFGFRVSLGPDSESCLKINTLSWKKYFPRLAR